MAKNFNLGNFFDDFEVKYLQFAIFSEKIGFNQIEGHI